MDPAAVVDETREVGLAAARLVDPHGDLGGMFAGPTTLPTDRLDALTVVDIRHIHRHHRPLLPLVMTAVAAWLQLATGGQGRGRFQVNDEAWALLSDEASARWLQANTKLSRALSLSVVNVLHRLSDTAAAGNADTATRALAEGVIADAGTWILYRQKPGEQPLLHDVLQLNTLQSKLATQLGRGRALWVVNGEQRTTHLVDHLLSPDERALVDTDQHMHAAIHDTGEAAT
jgi:type IV secretory pathway VirB4 component